MNVSLPCAHRRPSAKNSFELGIHPGTCARGCMGTECFPHRDKGCIRSGHISISGAWGLQNSENRGNRTYLGCVCSPLTSNAYSVDSSVCFNHFPVTERRRYFQGLTHLTCFRNVPQDEMNCIPEGLSFPSPFLKAIQMVTPDANGGR